MTAFLLDVTRWQAGIDLARARDEGFSLVNVQLTGRNGYVLPEAFEHVQRARSLGMGVCVYHWLDGRLPGAVQAGQTWQRIGDLGGPEGLAHQVDCEDTDNPATWPIWRDYVNAIQDRLGRHVAAYTGDWWWQPRCWGGVALTPYLWAPPNVGYQQAYPGDQSPLWTAGYGGWDRLSVMQYAVTDVAGLRCSLSAIRDPAVWAALTGGEPMTVLIPSLVALRDTFNRYCPKRDKTTDGWIGNEAHAAAVSDHNPDETGNVPIHDADHINEVHAIDVDKDLRATDARGAFTMDRAVRQIVEDHRAGRERRLRYVIFDGEIWSASWGWSARAYTGANPHDQHAHFSGSYDSAREADDSPWNIGFVEDDMPTAEEIAEAVWAKQYKDRNLPPNADGTPQVRTTGALLMDARTDARSGVVEAAKDEARDTATAALVQALVDMVKAGGGDVDTAALLAEIRSQGASQSARVERLLAEVDELQAANADLQAKLDKVPAAVIAEIAS